MSEGQEQMCGGCQKNRAVDPPWASAVAEAIPVPAALVTAEGHVLYANRHLAQMLDDDPRRIGLDGTMEGRSDLLLKVSQELPPLLGEAVRTGRAVGEVRLGVVRCDRSSPSMQVHAVTLPAGPNEPTPILVTFQRLGTAEMLRRELENCEARYQEVLQTSTDLICVMNPDGSLVFVNKSWQQHTGYTAAEIIGRGGLHLVCPGFRQTYRKALQSAWSGQCVENVQFRAKTKDGGHIDVLANFTPVRNAQGRVVQIIGSGRNITELKQTQEELKNSEERLRILFEYAPDAYYLSDMSGTFLDGNKAAEELCGYSRDELIGQSFLQLSILPRKQMPRAAGYLARNALGRPVGPVEFRLNRKNGSHVHVEVRTYPVRVGHRHVVLGIARDVSERKKAEEKLRESEEKFKILFEEAHEGIAYLDASGCVLDVNKRTLEILGQSRQEIVGKQVTELGILDSCNVPRIFDHPRRLLSNALEPFDLCITNKQNRKVCLECSISLVRRKGGSRGLVLMVRDVTERKQAEAMLEALNRDLTSTIKDLEHSNQELRDFAHVTAHDLKAPLRGIANLADWLVQDYTDHLDESGRQSLKLMQERVGRMTQLIDGILRYSEIGHEQLVFESIDTCALVTEVIEQIAPPEHITVSIEGTLPTVSCERIRLTQVFQNLISNAVKYIDKAKGEIRIAAVDRGDSWTFCVADNGPGIEERHFERIFQMFQTLSNGDRCESTGLGLAVVRKIVQRHGGRVWVESTMGAGSTFFFSLPKHPERATDERCQTDTVDR